MKSTRAYQRFNLNDVTFNLENLDFHPNINIFSRLNFGNDGSMLDVVNETKHLNKDGMKLGSQIVVARYRGKIIGWSCLDYWPETKNSFNNKRHYIYVYVSTRYRKRGVGSKLLKTMLKFCKEHEYTVKVCSHDKVSHAFFKIKNRMGRHTEYYRDMKNPALR